MNILLYNHSGCENRGCEAIVRSTSALFAQAGAHVSVTSGQAELGSKAESAGCRQAAGRTDFAVQCEPPGEFDRFSAGHAA